MSFRATGEKLSEFLTVEELLYLASLYNEIEHNSDQLVSLAVAFRMPIGEVYAEVISAQRLIQERVKFLKVQETRGEG